MRSSNFIIPIKSVSNAHTHTIILWNFIKPNITSLLNHLYNEFNKFY